MTYVDTEKKRSKQWLADAAAWEIEKDYEHKLAEIEAAITYGHSLRVGGFRRYFRSGEESAAKSLSREVRLVLSPEWEADWRPDWLWGREWWMTNRRVSGVELIAWTVDQNGRIVRGWTRHSTSGEYGAYDTPGKRHCPCEAAWMPSVAPGQISFPAFPFVRLRDGDTNPKVAETVSNLLAIRPASTELEQAALSRNPHA